MLGKKPSTNLMAEKSAAEHFASTKRDRAKIDLVAAEAAATDGKHWGRLRRPLASNPAPPSSDLNPGISKGGLLRFSVDLDVDRVGDDIAVVGQITMVIATQGDPNGMVAAGKFTEVAPLAIQSGQHRRKHSAPEPHDQEIQEVSR